MTNNLTFNVINYMYKGNHDETEEKKQMDIQIEMPSADSQQEQPAKSGQTDIKPQTDDKAHGILYCTCLRIHI